MARIGECSHPGCNCPAAEGSKYCGAYLRGFRESAVASKAEVRALLGAASTNSNWCHLHQWHGVRRPGKPRSVTAQESSLRSEMCGYLFVEFHSDQVNAAPTVAMSDASTASKKIQFSGADTNERSDTQGPVGDNQRTSSAYVPHERMHISNLPVFISPYDGDQAAGR